MAWPMQCMCVSVCLLQLMDSRAQLTSLREEHKEQEGGLVKGKKRAQQDVEGAVGEYDADVGAKDEEYGRSKAGYDVIIETLQVGAWVSQSEPHSDPES